MFVFILIIGIVSSGKCFQKLIQITFQLIPIILINVNTAPWSRAMLPTPPPGGNYLCLFEY